MRIVVEKTIERTDLSSFKVVDIPMSYHQRQKTRQKLTIDGVEIIIVLENRQKLKPYSVIFVCEETAVAYRVVPAKEEVLEISVKDKLSALQVGHLLGNMHLPVGYEEDKVTTLYDESVEQKLKKKGFDVIRNIESFIEVSEVDIHGHG